jgi:phosphoenolpyruvate synthase/pyruvate phosphate dikinase
MLASLSADCANLNVLVPFLSRADEYKSAVLFLRKAGFKNQVGIMVETPAAVLTLRQFIDAGAKQITIGLNDLTSLTLATERRSTSFDMQHSAVNSMIEMVKEAVGTSKCEVAVAGALRVTDITWLHRLGCDVVLPFAEATIPPWDMLGAATPIDVETILAHIRQKQMGRSGVL